MKFKPCPFCGIKRKIIVCIDFQLYYYTECQKCFVKTKSYSTEQQAIEGWNTRTDPMKDRLYEALIENDARICEAIEHEENQAGNHTQDLIQIHNTTRIIIKSHEDETNDPHL